MAIHSMFWGIFYRKPHLHFVVQGKAHQRYKVETMNVKSQAFNADPTVLVDVVIIRFLRGQNVQ